MFKIKRQFLRQSDHLCIQIFSEEKKFLFKGIYGSFFFPLISNCVYSKTEKKLWLLRRPKRNCDNLINVSSVLLNQVCLGVLLCYRKQLNIVGIGYQSELSGARTLILRLGFSHIVRISVPTFVDVSCPKPRIILLRGISFHKVNNFASVLRKLRLPSAYKQKGIYYSDETARLKPGKKT